MASTHQKSVAEETQEALQEISGLFQSDFALMDEVLDFVQGIVTTPIRGQKPRGLNRGVVTLAASLLAKGCKTVRAIKVTCGAGSGQDGGVLLRALFETTVALEYILRKNSKTRAILYAAHGDLRQLILMRQTKNTVGQKRYFNAAAMLKAQQKVDAWKRLVPGAAVEGVSKHWAGNNGLWGACRSLGIRSGYPRMYTLMYRHLSSYSHGADSAAHVFENPETGEPVIKILPGTDEIEANTRMGCLLLLLMARRFDKRLGCIGLTDRIQELLAKARSLPTDRRGRVQIRRAEDPVATTTAPSRSTYDQPVRRVGVKARKGSL